MPAIKATFADMIMALRERYVLEVAPDEFLLREFGAWAISNNHYDLPLKKKLQHFCSDVRKVFHSQHVIDDQTGHVVRQLHGIPTDCHNLREADYPCRALGGNVVDLQWTSPNITRIGGRYANT